MLRRILAGLAILLVTGVWALMVQAQESGCRLLDPETARRFLPDRVPMETEAIPLDMKNVAALEFPDRSRVAFAALIDSGLSAEMRQKYQYVLVSETRIRLDEWNVPAGVVGLGFEPGKGENEPTRTLIIRDFTGNEIDRIILSLDPNARESTAVGFASKGPKEFELRVGRYVIQGLQR